MEYITGMIYQLIIVLLTAPLTYGIINKVKAFTQKRKGSSIFQLYFDLWKQFTKEPVISEKASWIFKITPYIVFSSSLVAMMLIPISTSIKIPELAGDFILIISLLALGRFFQTLAGLDTGNTFGGMGSSREIMISFLFEPSLLVSFFTLGLISNTTSINGIFKYSEELGLGVLQPTYLLLFFAIFIILIAETSRIPVDDPATHLELTMVHEAMILEYSGKYLALIEYGAAIKQLIFITVLANAFIPISIEITLVSIAVYVLKIVFISMLVALIEVSTVKLRLFRISELAAFSFIISFLAFIQLFVLGW